MVTVDPTETTPHTYIVNLTWHVYHVHIVSMRSGCGMSTQQYTFCVNTSGIFSRCNTLRVHRVYLCILYYVVVAFHLTRHCIGSLMKWNVFILLGSALIWIV